MLREWMQSYQLQCISLSKLRVLAQLVCVSCCAGSGKTLAYLLPMLLALCGQEPGPGPRAVVMAPTRELAAQIARVLDALLPGSGLHSSLLSSSTAAGTDFGKVDGSASASAQHPCTAA
jgi:superfamily II DNA/RNA helicase